MINEETYKKLIDMKMYGLARLFREYLDGTQRDDALTFEERLGMMVDHEWMERESRRLKLRITRSKLREQACIEDVDYAHPRGLDRSIMQRLSTCNWIYERENLIVTGTSGLGKTWLSCALVHKACREGYTGLYIRTPRLLEELYIARGAGNYGKTIDRFAKPNILVLDDFGLAPLTDIERRDLFEMVEARHERGSTIVASQLQVKHWHEIIGEPTVADAILDRIVSSAHRIELKGKKTMRSKNSKRKKN